MKLSKISAALALACAALGSSVAFAAPSITNKDGTLMPFGGFDWASGGAAFSNNFSDTVGSTFTFTYASWAANIACTSGSSCTNLTTPNLDTNANGSGPVTSYEYTTFQTINGKVTSVIPQSGGNSIIAYTITGGTWDVYYDESPDANAVANGAWTGFIDGLSVLSGTWGTSDGLYATALATNSIGLVGVTVATDGTFISPDMAGTTLSSTLQLFGFDDTNFNPPTSIEGNPILSNAEGGNLFEADANQTFTPVPEPATLMLSALALLGLGVTTRRRRT